MSSGAGWGQVFAAVDNVFHLTEKLCNWVSKRVLTVVPDVRGLPYAEARQAILDSGLQVRSYSGPLSSLREDAEVLGQDPEPGQEVQRGHGVWLRVRLD